MKRISQIVLLFLVVFCALSCATAQNNGKKISKLSFPITVIKGEVTIQVSGYIDTNGIIYADYFKKNGMLSEDYNKYENDKIAIKTINETRSIREGEVFHYSLSEDEVVNVNITSANGTPATVLCSNNVYEIPVKNKYGINLLFKKKN